MYIYVIVKALIRVFLYDRHVVTFWQEMQFVQGHVTLHALSETAIFGRACLHEFPKKFINMKHGERFKIRAFLFFYVYHCHLAT